MRRKDKQINDNNEIAAVIKKCQVCRVAMAKDNRPYIIPVSFGYDGEAIYFHTVANEGMKLEYLSANSQVCFEFEHGVEVSSSEDKPCNWSFSFQSVIGFGRVQELKSGTEKTAGLEHIMAQYTDQQWDFTGIPLKGLSVWKIGIESITGKQSLNFME